jgi:hypothetical protein
VYAWSSPYLIFGEVVLVFLELFFVPFQIFDHEVLASEFVVVGKVVDDLMIGEPDAYFKDRVPDLGLKRFRVVHTVAQ